MKTIQTLTLFQTLLITGLLLTFQARAESKEIAFSSTKSQVSVIELYTSEGCSSCPPADRWLNKFKKSDLLWNKVVPLAFHVDYWDYLGWKDKFADKRFSHRQVVYQQNKYLSTVYTPGVMKNGREWRGWPWWQGPESNDTNEPGTLAVALNNQEMNIVFEPKLNINTGYFLNVALLGNDITSKVKAGENEGKSFEHEFVVLHFSRHFQNTKSDVKWNIKNPLLNTSQKINAIGIWITHGVNPTPIQATGTWIN